MSCNLCPHPTCSHGMRKNSVCPCIECDVGTLILDNMASPMKLHCNSCNYVLRLPDSSRKISTTENYCDGCGSAILDFEFNKNTTPLKENKTSYSGCIFCDETLCALTSEGYTRSKPRSFRGRGRRGKGRGRRRRGS